MSPGGTDPYISLAGANYQRQRVARVNHLSVATVNKLIAAQTTPPAANLFGEPAVNVVTLNVALQRLVAQTK
ncbi:potassium-transporting ATPase subunit C [Leuconostoc holzapfelii]|uniref:Potassium-transporting ATPase subunit C n=1 Tax=Leuconostoc holzapfelii TaxID=434464 RepID=A0A846ZH78_9LACO|nr:potassium-transporting ATPase subunit C [Leuconostoc holzapfelii]NKZ18701.1 potassium-transporting ATPase subunit C [Leuconostoc holzapfelii]